MQDKTLTVYIGSAEDARHDFVQAWKTGRPAQPVNRLSFESMSGFSKAFTPKRWEMLQTLKKQGKQNIRQLSQVLKRDYKNVYTDIQSMLELGLVEKDGDGLVFVPWDEIETHFKLAA